MIERGAGCRNTERAIAHQREVGDQQPGLVIALPIPILLLIALVFADGVLVLLSFIPALRSPRLLSARVRYRL